MNKRKVKLAKRITFVAIIVMVGLLIINSFIVLNTSKKSVEAAIGESATATASNLVNYLDKAELTKLIENPAENDIYWDIRERLNELREINGVMYAYTYFVPEENEGVQFLVDGMPIDDMENAGALFETSSSTTYEHIEQVLENGYYYTDIISGDYGEYISSFVPVKDDNGNVIAILGVDIDASYIKGIINNISKDVLPLVIGMFTLFIVIALGFLYIYINRALKPLETLSQASEKLSAGFVKEANDLAHTLTFKSNTEIAQFTETYKYTLTLLSSTFASITDRVNTLEQAVHLIETDAKEVIQSTDEISQSISGISASSEQQKGNTTEITHSITEMATGIQRMAESTNEIASASADMTGFVESGVRESQNVVNGIEALERSVLKTAEYVEQMGSKFIEIEQMVGAITNIADQTNLLALNASIEAARAGEAGKGFAVVADEVRKLSEMSRESADKINEQLQAFHQISTHTIEEMEHSKEGAKNGTVLVSTVNEQFTRILAIVESLNDHIQTDSAVIEEMSATADHVMDSTKGILNSIEALNNETTRVEQEITQEQQLMTSMHKSVEQLQDASKQVVQEIDKFKV